MGRYMLHGVYRLYKCVGLFTRPRKNPKSAAFLYFARRRQLQATRWLIPRANGRASSLGETVIH
jgi:hypothetical protein